MANDTKVMTTCSKCKTTVIIHGDIDTSTTAICPACGITISVKDAPNDTHPLGQTPIMHAVGTKPMTTEDIVRTSDDFKILITDPVNHPAHYTKHPSGIECIQITRHMNFNIGNAIKYLWRAGKKDAEVQDLKKAVWYIQDEIKRLEDTK